jgi:hypothetical protein
LSCVCGRSAIMTISTLTTVYDGKRVRRVEIDREYRHSMRKERSDG